MEMFRKFFMSFLAILCFALSVNAQEFGQNEQIKRRAAQKVAQMNDYISFMASKKKSLQNRKYYSVKALKLFIEGGNSYEENGVEKKGVMMEISSVNRNTTTHKLLRDYFTSLINLKYTDVKIESTEIANIKVSNLQQIDNKLYVCTCQYDQAFVGYRDGRPVYKDITTKRVKCYVEVEETEEGTEYLILLGDITALSTKRQ